MIYVLGGEGNLGHTLYKHLLSKKIEVKAIVRNSLDATDKKENIASYINYLYLNKGDFLINCIGAIPQKKYDNTTLNLINNIFPKIVADEAIKYRANFIQISTDCVYSGKIGKYTEAIKPDPISAYGHSKYNGETPSKAMVIRTSFIGQEASKNKCGLLEWFLHVAGNNTNGYINHYWNGLTTIQLSRMLETIITKNLYIPGLFHLYSPHTISKYELLTTINNEFKTGKTTQQVYDKKNIDRTLDSNNRWFIDNFTIPTIYEQVKELAERYDHTENKTTGQDIYNSL